MDRPHRNRPELKAMIVMPDTCDAVSEQSQGRLRSKSLSSKAIKSNQTKGRIYGEPTKKGRKPEVMKTS
jgi:hypothetical protein